MGAKVTDHAGDTEITLSTGKLLGIFFALAIVCGVFFAMGYLLGKSANTGGRTEIVGSVPANNNASKPSAANKSPEIATAQNCSSGSPNCVPVATGDTNTKGIDAAASPAASGGKSPDQTATQAGTEIKNGAGSSFMVQVAAVSKQEDAEILVSALRKKQYPVFIANSSGDPLFHVQVGPFTDRKDADAMRTRLAGDGYNAIVK